MRRTVELWAIGGHRHERRRAVRRVETYASDLSISSHSEMSFASPRASSRILASCLRAAFVSPRLMRMPAIVAAILKRYGAMNALGNPSDNPSALSSRGSARSISPLRKSTSPSHASASAQAKRWLGAEAAVALPVGAMQIRPR